MAYIKKKPLIGLTLDLENKKTYSKFPWYAIRENYCSSISKLGGIPIPLVYDINGISTILQKVDGIIITGGAFDIDPSYFSERKKFNNVVTKNIRTKYEISLCNAALKMNMPLLGICGGQQLLNVIYGGSLIQDINNEVNTTINHEQINPRNQTSHTVEVLKNTFLRKIVAKKIIKVNSAHHQAVKKPGSGLSINAISEDGIIEGIEDVKLNFCIGVQWHPEFLIKASDKKLLRRFVNESEKNANN